MDSEHRRAVAPAAAGYPNYQTVPRRIQQWCEREVLREILTQLANTLREEGAIDERERIIDAPFAAATGGGANPPGQRREDTCDCGSSRAATLGEHACGPSS